MTDAKMPERRGQNQLWEARFDAATTTVCAFCKVCDTPYPAHSPGCSLAALLGLLREGRHILSNESIIKVQGDLIGQVVFGDWSAKVDAALAASEPPGTAPQASSLRDPPGGGGDMSDTLDEIRAWARIDDRAFRLERTDALVEVAKARGEALRGALADIGYSADMTLKVARAKSGRVCAANPPAEGATV